MADTLSDAIKSASDILSEVFGQIPSLTTVDGDKFLDLGSLSEAYKEELKTNSGNYFDDFFKSIESMRSTYLPVEIVNQAVEISNDTPTMESSENTFMRMLGMPKSSDSLIQASETLFMIDESGNKSTNLGIGDIETNILDERQLSTSDRSFDLNIDSSLYSLIEEPEDDSTVNLNNIKTEFFKYSRLLFPTIQDSRISDCIMETSKMVAEPFSRPGRRTVNQQQLRSSLLETVIKIRIGKFTGAINFTSTEGSADPVESYGKYGIVESLFIIRLKAALSGLAFRLVDLQEEFKEKAQSSGVHTSSESGKGSQAAIPVVTNDGDKGIEETNIDAQIAFEDGVAALLFDNSEVPNISTGFKSSSVIDGHFVGPINSIINLPRQRLDKRKGEMGQKPKKDSSAIIEPIRKELGNMFGTSTGVGTIDVIAFSLALFTISEESLVGLLTEEQYSNLQKGPVYGLVPAKNDVMTAVNELGERVYEVYQSFLEDVDKDPV